MEVSFAREDVMTLRILSIIHRRADEAIDRRVKRYAETQQISSCAENGKVAVVWSGMDCDCVRYSGDCYLVEATRNAVDQHVDSYYEYADGPCGYYICKPSERPDYHSRDLAAEAFENGHPHHIYG